MNTELEKTYDSCIIRGQIIENTDVENNELTLHQNTDKIINMINEIKIQKTKTPEQKKEQFNKYYEALTLLKDMMLRINNVKIEDEQCKNTYLCIKYPSLELSFEFLENIRLKKEQKEIRTEDWTMIKINFELHTKSLLNKLQTNN